jgi:hypothetical protein
MLSSETKRILRKIRETYKDPLTKKPSFKSDDDVIEFAIHQLHGTLMG